MNIPQDLYYTKEHEWVKIEGKKAVMGISDHAQHALGDITFVELPKLGTGCIQFKQFATVESVKAASDIYAPLSGNVVKVNSELDQKPELINQAPYEQGWIAEIELNDEKEKNNLMDSAAYQKYLNQESH